METIYFNGITFVGCHGCTTEEKFRPQRIITDVAWQADVHESFLSDAPLDTVDWMPIQKIVEEVVTGKSRNTVEALASRIAVLVLSNDARTQSVTVSVSKPEELADRNGTPGVTVTLSREVWEQTWVPKGFTADWASTT
ncbi:MAG TPA: dihydroneopterin aldolase [Patescibacteria group bacterium]